MSEITGTISGHGDDLLADRVVRHHSTLHGKRQKVRMCV